MLSTPFYGDETEAERAEGIFSREATRARQGWDLALASISAPVPPAHLGGARSPSLGLLTSWGTGLSGRLCAIAVWQSSLNLVVPETKT